jgi:hypothetical protein
MPRVEGWLADDIDLAGGRGRQYPGRRLLVTANDYDLELFNGDTGVTSDDSTSCCDIAYSGSPTDSRASSPEW